MGVVVWLFVDGWTGQTVLGLIWELVDIFVEFVTNGTSVCV